jgi:uncharacterized small protein (DUF1192 family)
MALLEQKVLILEQKIDKLQKTIEGLKCYKARKKRTPTKLPASFRNILITKI